MQPRAQTPSLAQSAIFAVRSDITLKFAWFWPLGALSLGPHGGHMYHMNDFESPAHKADSCQVWLKSDQAFSRSR